jgi:hypothetical protein
MSQPQRLSNDSIPDNCARIGLALALVVFVLYGAFFLVFRFPYKMLTAKRFS